ncbi:hypothetical protein C7S18_23610 (plasmid) [Ahniella affigens]|uniref:Uncharacterized protein n=1 Tax=Ahniella affigens TaxID=2021234 RepID=A0A2P1PZM7_9GAMM|nr:hypothetical protein C7S18_23610 [Ahniella affigens]
MITLSITLQGKAFAAVGDLTWLNLSNINDPKAKRQGQGSSKAEPGTLAVPIRALKETVRKRGFARGCLCQDSNQPASWMLGTHKDAPKDAVSALVWVARSNPSRRVLYVEQLESGGTWFVATDQGRIAVVQRNDELIADDKVVQSLVNDVLEHWAAEEIPYSVVLNLRNRITTPLLERAIQSGQAAPGKLVDILSAPPPAEARFKRLLPLPLGNALLALAVVSGIAYFAFDWYMTLRAEQEALAELQRRQLAEAGLDVSRAALTEADATAQEAAIQAALQEDTATPVPQDVIMGCANLFARVREYQLGWELSEFSCSPSGNSATATYRLPLTQEKLGGSNATIAALEQEASVAYFAEYQRAVATFAISPPPIRQSLTKDLLPQSKLWIRDLGQRLQDLRTADLRLTASATDAVQRSVQYQVPVDPTVAETAGPKFADVSPERAYLTGTVALGGEGPLTLTGANWTEPHFSLKRLSITPSQSAWTWNLELTYVCRP